MHRSIATYIPIHLPECFTRNTHYAQHIYCKAQIQHRLDSLNQPVLSTLYLPCELLDVGSAVHKVILMVLVHKAGLLEVGLMVLEAALLEVGLMVLEVGLLEVGLTVLEVGLTVLEVGLTVLEVGLTVLEVGSIILEDDLTKFENVLGVVVVNLPTEFTTTTLMT